MNSEDYPFISVIVAARDEEKNIARCAAALLALDYPADKIEFLFGDDGSTDATWPLMQSLAARQANVKAWQIPLFDQGLRGKANVLDFLCRKAKGVFYLFTDADIAVPPAWAKAMLAGMGEKDGIATGFTLIEGEGLWEKLQSADWAFALLSIKKLTDRGIPVTSMGNNMLVRAQAYRSVGGYAGIPFSLTEDFALFSQIVKKGWGFAQLLSPGVTAYSLPSQGFWDLMRQRKRWMGGALQLSWKLKTFLAFQACALPFLCLLLAIFPIWVFPLWLAKSFAQAVFIRSGTRRAGKPIAWAIALLYEIYLLCFSFFGLLHYFLSGKTVEWKGRVYR